MILTCRLELLLTDFTESLAIVRYAEGSGFAEMELTGHAGRHVHVVPDLVRQPFDEWCRGLVGRYVDILSVTKSYVWQRQLGE